MASDAARKNSMRLILQKRRACILLLCILAFTIGVFLWLNQKESPKSDEKANGEPNEIFPPPARKEDPGQIPPEILKDFQSAMTKGWWHLGCTSDLSQILPFLRLFQRDNDAWIVDIGANQGQTSDEILQVFANIPFKRARNNKLVDGQYCRGKTNPGVKLLIVEPLPKNMELIKKRSALNNWRVEHIQYSEAAVSDMNGKTQFQLSSGTETGALAANTNSNGEAIEVEVITLDSLLERYTKGEKVFLLKIDTEGHDGKIINHAEIFDKHIVTYLVFEYHELWNNAESGTLEAVVRKLDTCGYVCFFITDRQLINISKWQDEFEIKQWSNVFCGLKESSDIEKVVEFYNAANGITDTADTFQWLFKEV